ncbi:MAG: pyridoxamine 5'-phosphate oxidase family protein [Baekduia sp.]
MSEGEVLAFLGEERIVTCGTNGPHGFPHLMPLWFVIRSHPTPTVWAWTFAKSQKTKNLERDPRATLQVEAGRDRYDQLRGVMLETEVVIHRDLETVLGVGLDVFRRYTGVEDLDGGVAAMVEKQAPKRVAFEFVEKRRATWDHRKLGGTY